MGDVIPGEPTCFDVVAKLEPGYYFLLLAMLVYTAATWTVTMLCHNVLEERAKAGMRRAGSSEALDQLGVEDGEEGDGKQKKRRCIGLQRFFAKTFVFLRIVNSKFWALAWIGAVGRERVGASEGGSAGRDGARGRCPR